MCATLVVGVALCLFASVAHAQVPALPEPVPGNVEVKCGAYARPADRLAELRTEYLNGRWERLQTLTRETLDQCMFTPPSNVPGLFPNNKLAWGRDYILVIFATTGANDEPAILKYLVHDPAPRRYATSLPGIPETLIDVKTNPSVTRLVQVYLSQSPGMKLLSSVQAKRLSDPVVEQTPDFLKAAIDPAVFAPLLKGTLGPLLAGAPAAPAIQPLLATVSIVPIHFRRGELTFSDVVKSPAFIEARREAALRASLNTIALEVRTELYSATSRGLSELLFAEATMYINATALTACSPSTYVSSCWEALDKQLQARAALYCTKNGGAACTTGEPSIVLARYRAAVAEPTVAAITSTSTFQNIPQQVVSFGVISAYVMGATSKKDRVKVDGAKIVADPLGRAMSLVTINFHRPFDSTAPDLTAEERVRVFVGSVVSPNFGFTFGAGVGLWRNVSINGGYALLAIHTLRPNDALDAAPADGKKPFRAGAAHIGFIGLGYKLK